MYVFKEVGVRGIVVLLILLGLLLSEAENDLICCAIDLCLRCVVRIINLHEILEKLEGRGRTTKFVTQFSVSFDDLIQPLHVRPAASGNLSTISSQTCSPFNSEPRLGRERQ